MAGALVSPLMSAPKLELPLRGLPILDSMSVLLPNRNHHFGSVWPRAQFKVPMCLT